MNALDQMYYPGILIGIAILIVLLGILIIQMKSGNRISRENSVIRLRRQFMDLQTTIASSEDLANLYQRGLRGFTGLSDTEQTRFFIISSYAFTHWSEVQRCMKSGLVSKDYWQEVQNQIQDYVQYPGVREFWSYRKHWYSQEFQTFVGRFVDEAPQEPKSLYPDPSV